MLQRGNSDAAKRVRQAKAAPSPPKRDRRFTLTDPAVLHEQAVVAAVRAHEIAYGLSRSSLEEDMPTSSARPSLERQGSHIARHLSNASSKKKPKRPTPSRSATAERLASTPSAMSTVHPVVQSTPTTNTAAGPGTHLRARNDKSRSEQRSAESPTVSTTASGNKLRKKDSYHMLKGRATALSRSESEAGNHLSVTSPQPVANDYLIVRQSPSVATLSRQTQYAKDDPQEDHTNVQGGTQKKENARAGSAALSMFKSRRISMNFTNTIKRAFSRQVPTTVPEIPPQQVQAHRPHYGSDSTSASRHLSGSTSFTAIDGDLDRQSSRSLTPVLRMPDALDISAQRVVSTSSADHYYTKSRVTSWMSDSSKDHTTRLRELEPALPSILESPSRNVSQAASLHSGRTMRSSHEMFPDVLPELDEEDDLAAAVEGQPKLDSKNLLSALRTHMAVDRRRQQRSSGDRTASKSTQRTWNSSDRVPSGGPQNEAVRAGEDVEMLASIRDFAVPECAYEAANCDDAANQPPSPIARDTMISPSIYSVRSGVRGGMKSPLDSAISLPTRTATPPGTAYVTEAHQVSKWSLVGNTGNASSTTPVISTSGEWRSWAADELADLEAAVSGPMTTIKHKRSGIISDIAQGRDSARAASSSTRVVSSVVTRDEEEIPLRRPKLLGTQSDSMNDRFPMLPLSQKPKRPSPASSRKTSSTKASFQREPRSSPPAEDRSSTDALEVDHAPIARKRSNLALHVMATSDMDTPAIPPRSPERTREERKARGKSRRKAQLQEQPSLALLLAEEHSREASRPQPQPTPSSSILEEGWLARLQRGPYAQDTSSSPGKTSSVDSLDLLSRRKGTGIGGLMKGMKLGGDENARPSPTKGQVMMDDFLGKRLSRGWREIGDERGSGQVGSSPRFL